MGRTNPTYRDCLRSFEDRYSPFRRALRRRHQADFDRLFERADAHAHAAGYQNATDPEVAALLSMLVAHEAELRELRERLAVAEGEGEPDDGPERTTTPTEVPD
ncbi:hypothetical protein [Haloarchaeobius sp. DYHT-AS-18]|uniref:hypothetical protein n=1 Tax=Haloarchaeobius sp. DYHT-AS-18 TaxID=3446117 RepID=UPI003EBFDE12